MLALFVKVPTM